MHPCALGLVLNTIFSKQHYRLGLVQERTETLTKTETAAEFPQPMISEKQVQLHLKQAAFLPGLMVSEGKKEFHDEKDDFNNSPFERRGVLRDPTPRQASHVICQVCIGIPLCGRHKVHLDTPVSVPVICKKAS